MICNYIADRFSCISTIILPHNREKATVCVFIIVLFAINKRKSSSIVFHYSIRILTTLNDTENKLLFGISSIKKTFNTHKLR